jgi:hypothetical protein
VIAVALLPLAMTAHAQEHAFDNAYSIIEENAALTRDCDARIDPHVTGKDRNAAIASCVKNFRARIDEFTRPFGRGGFWTNAPGSGGSSATIFRKNKRGGNGGDNHKRGNGCGDFAQSAVPRAPQRPRAVLKSP